MTISHRNERDAGLSSYRHHAVAQTNVARAIDMFVAGCVLARAVYAVTGDEGIACVASQSTPGANAYLFWSHQAEAEKWADALVANPRVVAIDFVSFIGETLPAMAAAGARAAVDWTSEPVEAELRPEALAASICAELTRDFAAHVTLKREVWVLDDGNGIASLSGLDGVRVTPLWADRQMGETVRTTTRTCGEITRVSLSQMTSRFLLSADGLKAKLAPAYVHSPASVIMTAWALKALLKSSSPSPPGRIAQLR